MAALCGTTLLTAPQSTARRHRRPLVFVNGDSLAVGTKPYLPGDLHGFNVRQSTSISRHAPQGVKLLRRLGKFPRVVHPDATGYQVRRR